MLLKPRVSVIITTRNRKSLLIEAINSVLGQSFTDFELIVVDNGSTDGTRQELRRCAESISYIYQENGRRSEARNTGIKVAQGDYIAFLDDDDFWLPDKLQRQVSFLDSHAHIGLVHNFTKVVNENGELLPGETKNRLKLYKQSIKIGYTYKGMSRLCVMFISSVMARKDCINEIGLFDPYTETFEDWDFYLRFSLGYQIKIIPEFLVCYRLHGAQTAAEEFTRGRINLSLKHLLLIESYKDAPFYNRSRYNFYMQLANAYYIDLQLSKFVTYAMKALKLNPLEVVFSRTGIHLLIALLPLNLVKKVRRKTV